MAPDVDETPQPGEEPLELVRRLAAAKAQAVDGNPVLAADTIVEIDGEVLGKPVDAADARRMLGLLSGRTHHVHTGVALRVGERLDAEVVTTDVTFVPLTAGAVDWYLPPASRSTRPAPTPSRAPAACSSTRSTAAPATSSACR